MASGRFITFEGPEGSGKTTQAARLVSRLQACGCDVVSVHEPGGTEIGAKIRQLLQHDAAGEALVPEAETLLFEASRAQLVRTVIRPALRRGAWVVSDRFADSTTVYQGYGRGLEVQALLRLNRFAMGATVPDMTILLDLKVVRALRRLEQRNRRHGTVRDRIEREARAFHERVRKGYRALARRWPKRFRVVNSDRPEDAVAGAVWRQVSRAFGVRNPS